MSENEIDVVESEDEKTDESTEDFRWSVINGDCLEVLKTCPDNYFDSVCTDPPAGVSFLNKKWDSDKGGRDQWIAWLSEIMQEVLRVTKPGGHGFVWALPRTSHWTAMALENAGWECRHQIVHIYGSGFPKSQDVGKFIDRLSGAKREVVGKHRSIQHYGLSTSRGLQGYCKTVTVGDGNIPAPATDEARQWDGWGTALKPAHEIWWLVRKPLSEPTIARNILKWGTGGLNIDVCRVSRADDDIPGWHKSGAKGSKGYLGEETFRIHDMSPEEIQERCGDKGRWAPDLLLSHGPDCTEAACEPDCPVMEIDRQSGSSTSGRATPLRCKGGIWSPGNGVPCGPQYGDTGGASRFFPIFKQESSGDRRELKNAQVLWKYQAKPSRFEKEAGLEKFEWITVEITWGNEVRKVRLLVDTALFRPKVIYASDGMEASEWSMMLFGNNTMAPSLMGWKYITKTKTSSIIISATLHWLTTLLTNVSTPDANCEMGSGGNLVGDVENLSLLVSTIDAKMASLLGVENVAVPMQVTIIPGGGVLQRMNPGGLSNDPRWASVEAKCTHPTVKAIALMAWLVKLITPPNGIILDNFAGSGSTGAAAIKNDFRFVGIDESEEYCAIARARIRYWELSNPTPEGEGFCSAPGGVRVRPA